MPKFFEYLGEIDLMFTNNESGYGTKCVIFIHVQGPLVEQHLFTAALNSGLESVAS